MSNPAKNKGDRAPRRQGDPCICGCGQPTASKGYDYVRGHRPPITLMEALSRGFSPTDGCWEWTRYVRPAGYGQVGLPGTRRTIDAHRASWIVHNGPIPDGMYVCHRCDNRKCVNPDHLFLGTNQDNMDDMWAKGRGSRLHGLRSPAARLTWAQVQEIRSRYRKGIHPARKTGGSASELAAEFGVTKQYINQLGNGEWRTVA